VLSALLSASSLAGAQSAPASPPAAAAPPATPPATTVPAESSAPSPAPETPHPAELEPALKPLVPTGQHENLPPPPPDPAAPPVSDYPPSLPAPPVLFGTRGTFALTGAFTVGTSYLGTQASGGGSEFNVRLIPSLDYFVAENLSLGGALLFAYEDHSFGSSVSVTSTTLGVELGVGYNVPFSQLFSWWPSVHFGFATAHTTSEQLVLLNNAGVPIDGELDEQWIVASAYLPFLIHPAPHFFVGIGPDAFIDIFHEVDRQDEKQFRFALSSVVGGWF